MYIVIFIRKKMNIVGWVELVMAIDMITALFQQTTLIE